MKYNFSRYLLISILSVSVCDLYAHYEPSKYAASSGSWIALEESEKTRQVMAELPKYANKRGILFIEQDAREVRKFLQRISYDIDYQTIIFGQKALEELSSTEILDTIFDKEYWKVFWEISKFAANVTEIELVGNSVILPTIIRDKLLLEKITILSDRLASYPTVLDQMPLLKFKEFKKKAEK